MIEECFAHEQVGPKHAAHRNHEQGRGQNQANPEAAAHVAQFRIFFFVRGDGAGLEGHAADRTAARLRADDLRMHRAGVFDFRDGERAFGIERHAATWTRPRTSLPDVGAHGTDVGALIGRLVFSVWRGDRCNLRCGSGAKMNEFRGSFWL